MSVHVFPNGEQQDLPGVLCELEHDRGAAFVHEFEEVPSFGWFG